MSVKQPCTGVAVVVAAALLLLVSPALGQSEDCSQGSAIWPDCLPNPLTGTYYIRAALGDVVSFRVFRL